MLNYAKSCYNEWLYKIFNKYLVKNNVNLDSDILRMIDYINKSSQYLIANRNMNLAVQPDEEDVEIIVKEAEKYAIVYLKNYNENDINNIIIAFTEFLHNGKVIWGRKDCFRRNQSKKSKKKNSSLNQIEDNEASRTYKTYLQQTEDAKGRNHTDYHDDWGYDDDRHSDNSYNDHSDCGQDFDDHLDYDDDIGHSDYHTDYSHSDSHSDYYDSSHTDESHRDQHTDYE